MKDMDFLNTNIEAVYCYIKVCGKGVLSMMALQCFPQAFIYVAINRLYHHDATGLQ